MKTTKETHPICVDCEKHTNGICAEDAGQLRECLSCRGKDPEDEDTFCQVLGGAYRTTERLVARHGDPLSTSPSVGETRVGQLQEDSMEKEIKEVADGIEEVTKEVIEIVKRQALPSRLASLIEQAVSTLSPLGSLIDRLSAWHLQRTCYRNITRFSIYKDALMSDDVIMVLLKNHAAESDLLSTKIAHNLGRAVSKAFDTASSVPKTTKRARKLLSGLIN